MRMVDEQRTVSSSSSSSSPSLVHVASFFLMFLGTVSSKRSEPQFRYRVNEEMPKGTVVCNLFEDVKHSYPVEILHLLRFRFLTEPSSMFDIGSTTGIITTSVVIDRDSPTLCRQKEQCEVGVDVVIQPSQHFQILKVIVEIVDVNDNAPRFRESRIALPINEAAAVGSAYIVPTASDMDSPANGVQRYELDSLSGRFGLQINPKLDGTLEVKLVLKAKLDRELESEYQLKLMAFDNGGPAAKTGVLTIDVLIQDSNDNRPEFTRHQYEASISENIPIGSTVLHVAATDKDAGPNGAVSYSFATQTQSIQGHLFAIDNRTGAISVKGVIDHEKSPVYQLVVIAQDQGPDMLSSEVTVIVHIDDVNDNPPSVKFHTLTSGDDPIAEILEDSAVGTFVAHISVQDPDSGRNGQVNCTINEKVFSLVQKYPSDYQIVTATMLDRERTDKYEVTLRCQDGAVTRLATEKMLRVLVTDVNDNSPVFDRQQYVGSLRENNQIGTSILQVTATDWDEGSNARVQYSLPVEASVFFHVDQRGIVSAHRSVDRETHSSFNFTVFATDLGNPSKTGSALVIINVEDTNDEKPHFSQHTFAFSVFENEPGGARVGVLTAEDRDNPPYNNFLFSLSSDSTISDFFSVDPISGVVLTQRPLDRESKSVYQFLVTVYDPHMSGKMDTSSVSVTVLDRNDNAPEFVFPNAFNNSVYISSFVPVGFAITRILARDADIDENARLSFKVEDNRHNNGTFRMESNTMVVAKRLPAIDYHLYQVNLQAIDSGNPSKSTTATIYIFVNQSIPFTESVNGDGDETILFAYNLVIVVGIASGCSVVVFLLVIAIIVVRQKDKRRHIRKYNCRMEALRMLTTKEVPVCPSSPEGSPRKKIPNGSKPLICKGDNISEANNVHGSIPKITGDSLSSHRSAIVDNDLHTKHWSSNKDLEVHPWIHSKSSAAASADVDKESVHSVEGSVTDSGRGPSEEGEAGHTRHNRERYLPPPPPPPRGAYWLQQKSPSSSSSSAAGSAPHPTVRFQGLTSTPEESLELIEKCSPDAFRDQPFQRSHSTLPYSGSTPPGILVKTGQNCGGTRSNRTSIRGATGGLGQQTTTLDQLSRQRTTLDQLSKIDSADPIGRPQLTYDRRFSKSKEDVYNQSGGLDRSTLVVGRDVIV